MNELLHTIKEFYWLEWCGVAFLVQVAVMIIGIAICMINAKPDYQDLIEKQRRERELAHYNRTQKS